MSYMGAVRLRLLAELRRQWRGLLALAVLLGVIGGVALSAAEGARRTDTAYPRFLRQSRAADLMVQLMKQRRAQVAPSDARNAARMTQLDLALKAHIPLSMIVRLEDGRRTAGLDEVKRIAEAVGIEPVELPRLAFAALEGKPAPKTSPKTSPKRRR